MDWIKTEKKLPPNSNEVFISDGTFYGVGVFERGHIDDAFSPPRDRWAINGTEYIKPVWWMAIPVIKAEEENQ